jgi:hypothetical protein
MEASFQLLKTENSHGKTYALRLVTMVASKARWAVGPLVARKLPLILRFLQQLIKVRPGPAGLRSREIRHKIAVKLDEKFAVNGCFNPNS